ncbi:MAG: glycosyltransferase family 2 protein [Myxococcales bacterium]|nr:glycosyltransferase family 2 protein [Myxococcales bacterium]
MTDAAGDSAGARVGVVLIGRNEGARLVAALDSVADVTGAVVYVDSGSTDASCAEARARGAEVVDLDMSRPFSAARARNAGFERLTERWPDVELVQFLDGDMVLAPGWIDRAVALFDARPEVVAVCGHRRERFPEQSVYNRLCDVEWRIGAPGETTAFGGDVMMRVAALEAVGGYDPRVIAAEDDELGVRLRAAGGVLYRLDAPSAWHDADMHHFTQWWQRAKRAGHAYAQVAALHGEGPERYFTGEVRRVWLWGLGVPAVALGLAAPTLGLSLGLLGLYPAQVARIARRTRRQGFTREESIAWALSCTAGKLPELTGLLRYHYDRARGHDPLIIEHKRP